MALLFFVLGAIGFAVSYCLTLYCDSPKPVKIFLTISICLLALSLITSVINVSDNNKKLDEHKQQCIELYRPNYKKMNECIDFYGRVDK